MSENQVFPADYYLSFPHLRLSRKQYLILENDSLYHVKIKKEQSYVTFIEYISEIKKMEVIMHRSKYGSHLYALFLPRVGKKKSYYVAPMKFGYRTEDWQRILEFFRVTGFIPHKHPKREKVGKHIPIDPDEHKWFSPNDRIFQLYEDPVFFQELSQIKIGVWPFLLSILGFSFIIPGIVFLTVAFDDLWALGLGFMGASVIMILLGVPKWIQYVKKAKEFGQRYNIEYYFK